MYNKIKAINDAGTNIIDSINDGYTRTRKSMNDKNTKLKWSSKIYFSNCQNQPTTGASKLQDIVLRDSRFCSVLHGRYNQLIGKNLCVVNLGNDVSVRMSLNPNRS